MGRHSAATACRPDEAQEKNQSNPEEQMKKTTVAECGVKSNRVSLWSSLEQGDKVILAMQGLHYHTGVVEDLTADGRTIWVVDAIGDRRLFHIDDEYELFFGTESPGRIRPSSA